MCGGERGGGGGRERQTDIETDRQRQTETETERYSNRTLPNRIRKGFNVTRKRRHNNNRTMTRSTCGNCRLQRS